MLALLVERGAVGVTMEAVAARAGTSKPVLYRRWADRSALLNDTLLALAATGVPRVDTGSFRGDLLAVLNAMRELFTGPLAAVSPAIVAAMQHDTDLARAFRENVIGWRKAEMAAMIGRGIERGEVRPDVSFEIVRELGQAMLWQRLLVTGDEITAGYIEMIVDEVLVPLVAVR